MNDVEFFLFLLCVLKLFKNIITFKFTITEDDC